MTPLADQTMEKAMYGAAEGRKSNYERIYHNQTFSVMQSDVVCARCTGCTAEKECKAGLESRAIAARTPIMH